MNPPPTMLWILSQCGGRRPTLEAATWLVEHRQAALPELLGVALGESEHGRSLARTALRWLARRWRADIEAAATASGVGDRVDEVLAVEVVAPPSRTLPKKWGPIAPPRRRDGAPATEQPLLDVLASEPTLDQAPLVDALALLVRQDVLRWLAEVEAAWTSNGSATQHVWIVHARALLGAERDWRTLGQDARRKSTSRDRNDRTRALRSVEALAAFPGALPMLADVAALAKGAAVRDRAAELLGLARLESDDPDAVLDAAVPTLGFDGPIGFDFGARSFQLSLGPGAELVLTDENGQRLETLPKPRAADDPALAKAAHAAWKELRADVAGVLATERARLELAMCTRREWSAEAFARLLAHPLLGRIASGLLWGSGGRWFRIAEDGSFADRDEEPFVPTGAVRLAHPSELGPEELALWQSRFADYRIVPPFPQVDREVVREDAPIGRRLAPGAVLGLNRSGWSTIRQWPNIVGAERRLGSIRAVLTISPGFDPSAIASAPPQRVEGLAFDGEDPLLRSEIAREVWRVSGP